MSGLQNSKFGFNKIRNETISDGCEVDNDVSEIHDYATVLRGNGYGCDDGVHNDVDVCDDVRDGYDDDDDDVRDDDRGVFCIKMVRLIPTIAMRKKQRSEIFEFIGI